MRIYLATTQANRGPLESVINKTFPEHYIITGPQNDMNKENDFDLFIADGTTIAGQEDLIQNILVCNPDAKYLFLETPKFPVEPISIEYFDSITTLITFCMNMKAGPSKTTAPIKKEEINQCKPLDISDPYPEGSHNPLLSNRDAADEQFEEQLSKKLQSKEVFNSIVFSDLKKSIWNSNKTIGVWSPLHRMGVTTFLLNFAIYMAKNKNETAVIETFNNSQFLKTLINRYTQTPLNWVSYIEALHQKEKEKSPRWTYKNVQWMPLGSQDEKFNIDQEVLFHFFERMKAFDFVFVDMPTGEMKDYTLDVLQHLDEIWVLCDDDYQHLLSWTDYIYSLSNQYDVKMYFIHHKCFPFSLTDSLNQMLCFPILTRIEQLYEECHFNHYAKKPLIEYQAAKDKLQAPFTQLIQHLGGNHTNLKHADIKENSIISKIMKIF
ncbi:hypothetical protein [Bacillus swezeyi]|nr:hypothetical protein [Bacillus swezeyi]